jgi:glucosyl-dolichyl phosphate glucuronosyltransferase
MIGISVLIPTRNRDTVLDETLGALTRVEMSGIDCEIIVIDNNDADGTDDVLASYRGRLPIISLKEDHPGKNQALNGALRARQMQDVIVFMDDDVTPAKDWLIEIASATTRWPDVSVFGGRIGVRWPDGKEPEWAASEWVKAFGFSWHEYAGREVFYMPPACPFGPNYWVRRRVFDAVPLFDETIGPRPGQRVMGSKASFLMELDRHGFRMLYCPKAYVEHRIHPRECSVPRLRRRGYAFGRGQVRLFGMHRAPCIGEVAPCGR